MGDQAGGEAEEGIPHDFPNHGTVYVYYAAWRDEGILAPLNYDLTGLARVKEGRKPEPTASVIDTQSVKTSSNVPLNSQGTDRREEERRPQARHPHRHDRPHPRRDRHRRRPVGKRPGNTPPRPSQVDLPDDLQELGRHRLQERRHRTGRPPRNRRRSRQQKPRNPRASRRQKALGSGAEHRSGA